MNHCMNCQGVPKSQSCNPWPPNNNKRGKIMEQYTNLEPIKITPETKTLDDETCEQYLARIGGLHNKVKEQVFDRFDDMRC